MKNEVRRIKYVTVLAVANRPDTRGIVFTSEALQNLAKYGKAKNYHIQIGNERYEGQRLYMSGEQLICEFAV